MPIWCHCMQGNRNVSTSVLSRDERKFVQSLTVKLKPIGQHGNSKASCWRYFGVLTDNDGVSVDEDRLYCRLCIDDQKALGDRGHLSKVTSFAATTSSGNMNLHLSQRHDIVVNSDNKVQTLMGYVKKYSDEGSVAGPSSASSHEVTRDIVLWFCRDLLAFENVGKEGLLDFFRVNVPSIHLPSAVTLAGTALEDVYQAIRREVKNVLADVKAVCLMFDGWTDRYKARSYLGVRASFLQGQDWSYSVATLGCHVLPSHTARDVADHVSAILKTFFPDPKKLFLTSCHDGAANMMKTSKLLKVDSFQHCAAHSLHLLLTTDSIQKFGEVTDILQKCRNIVTALHFKSALIEDEVAASADKVIVTKLQDTVAQINNLLDLDKQFSETFTDEELDDSLDSYSHTHASLKAACPTRWNSNLEMLESIVDLKREVQNSLKRIGRAELSLHEDELDFIVELISFLKPFRTLSDLFSLSTPTLSTVPLIKMRIRKICAVMATDDERIKQIKQAVMEKLNDRFPISDEVKLHQLLDPDTKNLIPRAEGTALLEKALQFASDRGLISITSSSADKASTVDSELAEPQLKRLRMKMELMEELRSESQSRQDVGSAVTVFTCSFLFPFLYVKVQQWFAL